MTAKTSSKKPGQTATTAVVAAKSSKPSLLPDADAEPDWDEYTAICDSVRMVTIILDRDNTREAMEKWEELWGRISEVQQARAAFFLTFAAASSLSQFGTDARANLRNLTAYWLLPDELFKNSDGKVTYAPTAGIGTDG